jgi:hypothetical protein
MSTKTTKRAADDVHTIAASKLVRDGEPGPTFLGVALLGLWSLPPSLPDASDAVSADIANITVDLDLAFRLVGDTFVNSGEIVWPRPSRPTVINSVWARRKVDGPFVAGTKATTPFLFVAAIQPGFSLDTGEIFYAPAGKLRLKRAPGFGLPAPKGRT